MAPTDSSRKRRLVEAARSIAFSVWLAAVAVIPPALLLRSYDTALLVVILAFFWQFLAVVLSAMWPEGRYLSHTRFRARLTSWGGLYCGIAVVCAFMSLHWGINLLYLTAAFLLAAAVCAAAWPWLLLAHLGVDWDVPERVFAGEPFRVGIRLRNAKRFFSAFALSLGLNAVGEGQEVGWLVGRLRPGRSEGVPLPHTLPRRGLHPLHALAIRTSFPFGVLEATREVYLHRDVLVLPRLGHIDTDVLSHYGGSEPEWAVPLRRRDSEGEYRGLREYQPGDNPRLIHWPTSARLHKLYIREFEQQQFQSVLILLDAHAPAESPERTRARQERFDLAVSFVATLADLLTRRNVFYAFASYCPEPVVLPYDTGRGHLDGILEVLALAGMTTEHTPADLGPALGGDGMRPGGACVVTPGPLPNAVGRAMPGLDASGSLIVDVSQSEFDELFRL